MLKLNVNNETSRLLEVILGTAKSIGPTPKAEDCYDPKSRENVLKGTYPNEMDMCLEIQQFKSVLEKYNINKPDLVRYVRLVPEVGADANTNANGTDNSTSGDTNIESGADGSLGSETDGNDRTNGGGNDPNDQNPNGSTDATINTNNNSNNHSSKVGQNLSLIHI